MIARRDDGRWADLALMARLLAIDPLGLGGICIRGGHASVRDAWLGWLRAALPTQTPIRRMPLNIGADRLLGGLDLAATLHARRPVAQRGLLADADGGFVVLPMAERLPRSTLAHLLAALDTRESVIERDGIALRQPARFGAVAFDDGIDDEEGVSGALLDRLAFLVDASDLRAAMPAMASIDDVDLPRARARLPEVRTSDTACATICDVALRLGIGSIRPSIVALRVAQAFACLEGRSEVADDDLTLAARLVLAPRAARLPETEAREQAHDDGDAEASARPQQTAAQQSDDDGAGRQAIGRDEVPQNLVLAAAVAAIPPGLLARIGAGKPMRSRIESAGRAGASLRSAARGRAVGARRGDPRHGRLNLIETLRAAAPWQPLRRAESKVDDERRRVHVRRDDFRVVRYQQRTRTTTIFVVDASGSSALSRLAEAKGAVELLLAECYVRRDEVAVIAFRGQNAELLLPPTRSLVRARRNLAGLPGGGGTPLASAIDAGAMLAQQVARAGRTPTLILLTDGRANVARDGSAGRERAELDARAAARRLRATALGCVFIDISPRANAQARQLADEMAARYLALPYADAATLSSVVAGATGRTRS